MKILVLGAPRSGKTKFGKKKAEEHSIKLLDNLPKKYITKTGLALGRISDYRVDVMFAGHILEQENKYKDQGYVITSSLMYTLAHFAMKVNYINDEKDIDRYLWPGVLLAKIVEDSLWYDEIYYLPYKGEDEYSKALDKSLRQVMSDRNILDRVIRVE
jgi:hypothetical protein